MIFSSLQQHLPFTVLKPSSSLHIVVNLYCVATTPTVYGIETAIIFYLQQALRHLQVATTPTVYGIETRNKYGMSKGTLDTSCNNTYRLRY